MSGSYYPVSMQFCRSISYRHFETKLKEHYNREGHLPVELALISLSRDSSWNQRVLQVRQGNISFVDQVALEHIVQIEADDFHSIRMSHVRGPDKSTTVGLFVVIGMLFTITLVGLNHARRFSP